MHFAAQCSGVALFFLMLLAAARLSQVMLHFATARILAKRHHAWRGLLLWSPALPRRVHSLPLCLSSPDRTVGTSCMRAVHPAAEGVRAVQPVPSPLVACQVTPTCSMFHIPAPQQALLWFAPFLVTQPGTARTGAGCFLAAALPLRCSALPCLHASAAGGQVAEGSQRQSANKRQAATQR